MKQRFLFLFLAITFSSVTVTLSQVISPFTSIYKTSQRGGIVFLSNVAVGCSTNPAVGTCSAGTNETPPAGTTQNSGYNATYVDIDGDGSTFMSSSDSLNLPSCSEITAAYLFWGASGANTSGLNSIKLKINNSGYQGVLAAVTLTNNVGYDSYHCYADVTYLMSLFVVNSKARITVADIPTNQIGNPDKFGSWNLVVVYKNNTMPLRQLNVLNGLANVALGSAATQTVDVNLSGFLTPPAGAVNFEVGVYAHDGDRSAVGDNLAFNGVASFIPLSDASNVTGDLMNSTVTYSGTLTPFRVPNMNNSTGLDADIYVPNNLAKNYIGNTTSTATLQMNTLSDNYLTQCITTSIDDYEPFMRTTIMYKDINGGNVLPGDVLEYRIRVMNTGLNNSINTFITDTLDINALYIPNSLKVTFGPNSGNKTDATGDDQAEYVAAQRLIKVRVGTGANSVSGGVVNSSLTGLDSTVVTYSVNATSSCLKIICDAFIDSRAYAWSTGAASTYTNVSASVSGVLSGNGCEMPGPTSVPITATNCGIPFATNNSPVCVGGTFTLSSTFDTEATYSWSGPNSFTSSTQNNTITAATQAMSGTYQLTLSIPGTQCMFPAGTTVTVNVVPSLTISATPTLVCTGDPVILNASGAQNYTWNPGAQQQGTVFVNPVATTQFTAIGENPGCPTTTAAVSVSVNPVSIAMAGSDKTVCVTTGSTNLAGNTSTAGIGTWTKLSGPGGSSITNPTLATTAVTGLVAGVYVFQWQIVNPPCTTTSTVQITVSLGGCDDDGDGTQNYADIDNDNDGLTDASEGATDFDGDGVPNFLDLDSDNDGILDLYETSYTAAQTATLDANTDGKVDGAVGANGMPNAAETSAESGVSTATLINTDGDGVPNYHDLDSDNDGIFDITEAGYAAIDANFDGIADGTDTDADGIINANPIDVNAVKGGSNGSNLDLDGDLAPNSRDLDTDNDALLDVAETRSLTALDTDNNGTLNGTDTDGDGIINVANVDANATYGGTGTAMTDTDGDGKGNYRDLDSDNDGIMDASEVGFGAADTNGDGMVNGTDTDGDGIINVAGLDINAVFGGIKITEPDTDSDTKSNQLDLDSDNDGVLDVSEAGFSTFDANFNGILDGNDTDGDGIINNAGVDNNATFGGTAGAVLNTDGDAKANFIDLDSDNDGISDLFETGIVLPDAGIPNGIVDGSDTDGDGIINVANLDANATFGGSSSVGPKNSDGDSRENFIDLDSDNDGIGDLQEAGYKTYLSAVNDANNDGVLDGTDTDGDGVVNINFVDNNAVFGGSFTTPSDIDVDLVPNHVDLDSDNDGISDVAENGNGTTDSGNDGMVDGSDVDGDGIIDATSIDNNSTFGGTAMNYIDKDGDQAPNAMDLDSDNDGIGDVFEDGNGSLDTDKNGAINGTDTDGDGIVNNSAIDNNSIFGGTALSNTDSDGDGAPNNMDLDADNDGISDIVEDGNSPLDFEKDGVVNGTDTDYDGIINNSTLDNDSQFGGINLSAADMDGDNIGDNKDLDSDRDGITDINESGSGALDTNGDGMADGTDTDGDGIINVAGLDNNATYGGTTTTPVNTDNLLGADYLDIDSDNDGIVDIVEAQNTTAYLAPSGNDTDNDGLDNTYDNSTNFGGNGLTPVNTDGADVPDYLDANSDSDGLNDAIEGWDTDANGVANKVFLNIDVDGDGLDSGFDANDNSWISTNGTTPFSYPNLATAYTPERDWRENDDFDRDGLNNVLDFDDDNDGIRDDLDGFTDNDGDGLPDNTDLDSDNDGITDVIEAGGTDNDGDGIYGVGTPTVGSNGWPDPVDNTISGNKLLPEPDTDNDSKADCDDVDSDNDGLPDVFEAHGIDGDNDARYGTGVLVDMDGDGLHDNVDPVGPTFPGVALVIPDTDKDGKPDYRDIDSDADGLFDIFEQEGGDLDKNTNGVVDATADTDADGWADVFDPSNGGILLNYAADCDGVNGVNYVDPNPCEIKIPQGFSPNGDAINDFFVIKGLGSYPDNKLSILNRWGVIVYEKSNYDNTWDGKSNKGSTIGGNELPEATYFYILELGSGKKPLKGYVYLNKSINN